MSPSNSPPESLAPSVQARLGVFADLRHPHLRNVSAVDATGVHFTDPAEPLPDAVDLASLGYAVAAALEVIHHMGFEHRAISLEVLRLHDGRRIVVEVTPAAAPADEARSETVGKVDLNALGQLLTSKMTDATDQDLVEVIDHLCGDDPPTAELAVHVFAAAGARATVRAPSVAAAVAEHTELFLEPSVLTTTAGGRTASATRRALAVGGLAALGGAAVAFAANLGGGGDPSRLPCTAAPTVSCDPVADYDPDRARLRFASAAGMHRADLGEPGDRVFLAATACPGDDRVVLFRPSTHEVFLFAPPPEAQRAPATFVADDVDAAWRAVSC